MSVTIGALRKILLLNVLASSLRFTAGVELTEHSPLQAAVFV